MSNTGFACKGAVFVTRRELPCEGVVNESAPCAPGVGRVCEHRGVPIERYVFIAGCPRSGTSALTFLLNEHPTVAIGFERYKRLRAQLDPFHFTSEPALRAGASRDGYPRRVALHASARALGARHGARGG